MPDDLRTRIAAAIEKADQDWCSDNNLYDDMAAAVIREIGLAEERLVVESLHPRAKKRILRQRYVTEWETDGTA